MSGGVRTIYLFLYNCIQWFGWVAILTDRLVNCDQPDLTPQGAAFLYVFQMLAMMEVLHSASGLVHANLVTTVVQVASRVQLIMVHAYVVDAQHSSGLLPMIVAWGCVEVVRYLYLALNLLQAAPRWLTWLRYSAFYILYPLGVYGEMRVLYDSLPSIHSTGIFSLALPNAYNFEFSFASYISLLLYVIYLPGLLFMKSGYLFLYNMIQWGGWLMILFEWISEPRAEYSIVLLYIFEIFSLAEILHVILKIVPSNILTTMVQVLGRLQVLAFMHYYDGVDSWGVLPMVYAWALVEIVRYLYLGLHVVGVNLYPLLWLRYSLFYILYPIGVIGEIKLLIDIVSKIDSYYLGVYVRVLLWLIYIPAFIFQYKHMISQRVNILSKSKKI